MIYSYATSIYSVLTALFIRCSGHAIYFTMFLHFSLSPYVLLFLSENLQMM